MLQLKDVKKFYKKKAAVDGVNITIPKGAVLGLIGANGAGKSTTISMIATLTKPDAGVILYQGEDIVKKPKIIRKDLGFVPQEIALYMDLTGMDNLKFWGDAYHVKGKEFDKRLEWIRDMAGLDLDTLNKKVKNCSGGMKRRLNIGVALLNNPGLVIMDEPTVGIDLVSRKKILDSVRRLNEEGVTILYTGHYMEEMEELCSHVCILDKGHVIKAGSKNELLCNNHKNLEELYMELVQ